MTTTPHGQVPEALRLAAELEREKWHVPAVVMQAAAEELRRLHAYCQELESQVIRDCMTHVQNPAEIVHAAGDVSKNVAESNMSTRQPAPAIQQAGVTEPTDAVLFALIEKHLGLKPRRDDTVIDPRTGRFHGVQRYRDFTHAVLAHWGQPSGAGMALSNAKITGG